MQPKRNEKPKRVTPKLAYRWYACVHCRTEQQLQTNHTMRCYAQCKGKCIETYRTGRGAAEQEHVYRQQTEHEFMREVTKETQNVK